MPFGRLGLGLGLGSSVGGGFDPLTDIENLALYVDSQEQASFTFVSGSGDGDPIESWADLTEAGNDLSTENNAKNFIYKEFAMYGKPAARKSNVQAILQKSSGLFSGTVTLIEFFALVPDRTVASGGFLNLFNTNSQVANTGDTQLYWFRNQANGNVVSTDTYDATQLTMVVSSIEDSETAFFQVNNGTKFPFDPNVYDTASVRVGSITPTTNAPEIEVYGLLVIAGVPDDATLSKIYNWGLKKYGNTEPLSFYAMIGESTYRGQRATNTAPIYNNRNRMFSLNANNAIQLAVEPALKVTGAYDGLFDPGAGQFGPAFPFAEAIANATSQRPCMVMLAKDGTEIAEWARNDSDPEDDTTYYGVALRTLKYAKENGTLKWLLISLGANDALAVTGETAFKNAYTDLVANFRSDLELPDIPVLINGMNPYNETFMSGSVSETNWNNPAGWLVDLAGTISNAHHCDNSNMTVANGNILEADIFHPSSQGNSTLGDNNATVILGV